MGQESSDEKKSAAVFKSPSGVEAPSVKEVQSETKKKFEPTTSEQVALTRKNAGSVSQETAHQVTSSPPTQASGVDIAKPRPNPVAKNPTRDNPLRAEAGKSGRERDDEAASVAKSTAKARSLEPLPATGTVKENSPSSKVKLPNEQIALLKNGSSETAPERRTVARSRPKVLEGYIIQVGFNNKSAAQHWGETLERRGYAISLTEADGAGLVRLRLGNFSVREEAERQLRSLKQEGLSGIVINLPQAYRPEMRAQASEESQKQSARTDN